MTACRGGADAGQGVVDAGAETRRALPLPQAHPRSLSTPCTLHPTLHNPHSTPHTLHPTTYTPHPTHYTPHFTPHAPPPTPCTLNSPSHAHPERKRFRVEGAPFLCARPMLGAIPPPQRERIPQRERASHLFLLRTWASLSPYVRDV